MKQVVISVQGPKQVADLEALSQWLGNEPELRGLVKPVEMVPALGELGALSDTLIAAVGTGGAISVLASSLKAFLSQPRGASVQIKVIRPDGTTIELTADRTAGRSVPDLAQLLLGAPTEEE